MNRIFLLTAVLILLLNGGCNIYMYNSTERYNLEPIVTLEGDWKFNIGDDPTWASKSYDDSTWDYITVPGNWQDQGYHQYLGYAWYRTKVFIPRIDESDNIYLYIDAIDDVSEVYINGILIGQTGNFLQTTRLHIIFRFLFHPQSLINYDGENTLAIRVYNDQMDGGIVSGPVIIGYFEDDMLLDQNLAGSGCSSQDSTVSTQTQTTMQAAGTRCLFRDHGTTRVTSHLTGLLHIALNSHWPMV